MSGTLTVRALPSPQRFAPGDDLVAALLEALALQGERLRDGDVVCVASKAVALAEGRAVAGDDVRALALERASEVVVDAPWVLITRTPHGFVAANGGIDRSNVFDDALLDLPVDPDASATRLRADIAARTGTRVGIIITDTFGRAWRVGQTDVALGVAGVAAIRDERGGHDLDGRELLVTEAAIADELAGAADLVRRKDSGAAFVLIRGLDRRLIDDTAAGGSANGQVLVRGPEHDLFRFGGARAVEHGLAARRTVRAFDGRRTVPHELLARAVDAAATAPAPHHTRPWRVVRLTAATRTTLLDAMADTWREDLRRDGVTEEAAGRRIARSDSVLRTAPELLALFVDVAEAHRYPDVRRRTAERDLFLLSGGAAIEAMLVALAANGLGAAWISSTVFCPDTVRRVLDVGPDLEPIGMVAVGWPASAPTMRAPHAGDGLLEER
jgi:coenzyme F420-0:L-glutamate ligase / coenzyme F420-1:gamma-L-glutamate ligase